MDRPVEKNGEAVNPEVRTKFAVAKARVVTTLFHTLRYPQLHQAEFTADHDMRVGDMTVMRQGDVRRTAEAELLDVEGTPRQKARYIMEQFAPVAGAITATETEPDSRYGALLALSEQGTVSKIYRDDRGQQLTPIDILPPPMVIEGMFDTYTNPERTTCPELEAFIENQAGSEVSQPVY